MSDTLFVTGLEAQAILGVDAWERVHRQSVRIDLEMAYDGTAAAAEDDLAKAVNYRTVADAVLARVEASAWRLVESLAEDVARVVLGHAGIPWVRVRVTKPGALPRAHGVGLVIERGVRPDASRRGSTRGPG